MQISKETSGLMMIVSLRRRHRGLLRSDLHPAVREDRGAVPLLQPAARGLGDRRDVGAGLRKLLRRCRHLPPAQRGTRGQDTRLRSGAEVREIRSSPIYTE